MAFGSPSNGPRCGLERGRRRWSPERSSEAARGKEIAGVCHIGGPGVSLTRFWVRSDQRRMRDPPGSRSGQGDARSGARDGGGNSGRRGFAGAHTFRRRRGRSWTLTGQGASGEHWEMTKLCTGLRHRGKVGAHHGVPARRRPGEASRTDSGRCGRTSA